ncbi:hypothetical protein SBRCBS47491_004955 [Sporothrix bragantina]|uniref:Alpha/beta hydrolase fold-3 domain-containing protein n=1 Tax=Sporothrix bragantina TaxID=671064 RepID=A0ABP0BUB6_9PEZI
MSLYTDSEVTQAYAAVFGENAVGAALDDQVPEPGSSRPVAARRASTDAFWDNVRTAHTLFNDVDRVDYTTTSADGHTVPLKWYAKQGKQISQDKATPTAAVVYIHGGGMILGSVANYDFLVARYASESGVPFLAVEYRLCPEVVYPAPIEDCYAAVKWLHEQAATLNVDPARIAVMGDSAGGLYAALLDDRTQARDNLRRLTSLGFADIDTAWWAFLGNMYGTNNVPEEAAPGRLVDATGLPELYLDVGELDLFCVEDTAYAVKHMQAGIRTELHIHPGVPHGWEVVAPHAAVSKRAFADRTRAIQAIGQKLSK